MAWYTEILEEYDDEVLARLLSRHRSRGAMVKMWSKFDWVGLEAGVFESLQGPLLRFLQAHKKISFTRLALDVESARGELLLSLDGSYERDRLPGDYEHRDLVPRSTAGGPWRKRYLEALELVVQVETLDEICDELDEGELPDEGAFRQAFLRTCAQAALRLEQVAQAKANAAAIEALVWDHEEGPEHARARMGALRKPNSSKRST